MAGRCTAGRPVTVLDARGSPDLVVVSTAGPGGASGPDPAVVAVVPAGAGGLASDPVELVDGTRCADTVSFSGVRVTEADVLAGGDAARQLTTALANRAAVALAADSVGAARRLLDLTVAYIKQREQFGRPIGGFQAVKHHAADMLVNVETSSALLDGAVREAGESPFSSELASMAKEYCCCERAAGDRGHRPLQLHGRHRVHLGARPAPVLQAGAAQPVPVRGWSLASPARRRAGRGPVSCRGCAARPAPPAGRAIFTLTLTSV